MAVFQGISALFFFFCTFANIGSSKTASTSQLGGNTAAVAQLGQMLRLKVPSITKVSGILPFMVINRDSSDGISLFRGTFMSYNT